MKSTLSLEERAAVLAEKYTSTYNKVKRDNSIDDLMKTINENKIKRQTEIARQNEIAAQNDDENDSSRSTPDYLKKYSVNYHFSQKAKNAAGEPETDGEVTETEETKAQKRLRTFSETLKMLDDDILAELDVK